MTPYVTSPSPANPRGPSGRWARQGRLGPEGRHGSDGEPALPCRTPKRCKGRRSAPAVADVTPYGSAIRCEPIPVIIGRTPERSKPALLEFPSGEKPALL